MFGLKTIGVWLVNVCFFKSVMLFNQVEGCDKVCCYWFIGLKVELKEGNAGGQLDLTTPIKAFTDIVMRSAIQINVWKTGILFNAL